MDIQSFGRLLLLIGLSLAAFGGLLWFAGRFFSVGELPGDIRVEGQVFTCFVPVVSMLLISIVLSVVLNIILRIINR